MKQQQWQSKSKQCGNTRSKMCQCDRFDLWALQRAVKWWLRTLLAKVANSDIFLLIWDVLCSIGGCSFGFQSNKVMRWDDVTNGVVRSSWMAQSGLELSSDFSGQKASPANQGWICPPHKSPHRTPHRKSDFAILRIIYSERSRDYSERVITKQWSSFSLKNLVTWDQNMQEANSYMCCLCDDRLQKNSKQQKSISKQQAEKKLSSTSNHTKQPQTNKNKNNTIVNTCTTTPNNQQTTNNKHHVWRFHNTNHNNRCRNWRDWRKEAHGRRD